MNCTGAENVAMGYKAGYNHTTAANGIYIGMRAGYGANSTGHTNIYIGNDVAYGATTGYNNVILGSNAGYAVGSGAENVMMGLLAGRYAASNNYNTFLGSRAGYAATSNNNVCIGAYGASNLTSGTGTVIIGYNAQPDTATASNEIILGYSTKGVGGGHITLGISLGSDRIYNLPDSNGSWTKVSDERYKDNIQDNTDCGLNFINDLRPVTFKFKALADIDDSLPDYDAEATERKHECKHYGLIAQEVKTALDKHNITDFAGWDQKDGIQAISQEMFVNPLIKAVQELTTRLEAAEAEIKTLKG